MELYLIDKGELKKVSKPIFSTGDVYLLDDGHTIYVWIGSQCTVDEKTTGAAKAREMDKQRGGSAKIITVDQGQETKEFLKLISNMGVMKIVKKNIAKTMLKDVYTGDFAGFTEHKNVLYRVSSEEFEDINAMKMIQVPYSTDSLDSEDSYVLDLGTKVYIWQGNASNVKEKVKAGQWARKIDADRAGSQNEEIFEEGDDAQFIEMINKGPDYKESDAVQLEAESELDDDEEQHIEPETKAEIKDVEEEPADEIVDVEEEPAEEIKDVSETREKVPITEESPLEEEAPLAASKQDILTIEKTEGRRVCPHCGNSNPNMIYESTDKENIIMDYPRVYGKKYKCGECGQEWREK
ncbi:MAG: hypothetical protein EU541_03000 [Promethearchaeota archaeon]|nr:MAG: hypothetical protein EU541_03000 [Candidatus Lokiarchaeota archaeon]